ncbi:MAG: hypothetical protein AB8G86_22115 [Saprospiraceae bacterium]
MVKIKLKCLLFFIACGFYQLAVGQSSVRHSICLVIPEIAILDIEPNNTTINLSLNAPTESGTAVTFSKEDASKWLNYTSAIAPNGASRSIAAQISGNSIPEGLQLYLEAGNYRGSGGGTLGKSTGKMALDTSPRTIVSDIGRSYTGNGTNNGHQLKYALSIADYGKLNAETNQQVMVIFTITE